MKNKLLYIFGLLFVIVLIVYVIYTVKLNNNDAIKFKREYESLNNKYIKVEIYKNNPFKYTTLNEILNMIKNKESIIVFIGNSADTLTRILLPNLIDAANNQYVDKIYYIDIDTIDNKSENFQKLLELLNEEEVDIPQLIAVVNGNIKGITSGVSNDMLYQELTEEDINNSYTEFINILSLFNVNTCDESC